MVQTAGPIFRHEGASVFLCKIIRVTVAAPDVVAMAAPEEGYLPRKPLPRKKIPADIRSLCRAYTDEGIRVLASIMRQPEHPSSARVSAAIALLDREWGRPPQAHAGEDGEGQIEVVIRHLVEGVPGEHLVIETLDGRPNPAKIEAGEGGVEDRPRSAVQSLPAGPTTDAFGPRILGTRLGTSR